MKKIQLCSNDILAVAVRIGAIYVYRNGWGDGDGVGWPDGEGFGWGFGFGEGWIDGDGRG